MPFFCVATSIHSSGPQRFQAESPTPARWQAFVDALRPLLATSGGLSLLTCNRAEFYAEAPLGGFSPARLEECWRLHFPHLPVELHIGKDAVHHLFRIAAGIESLVPGEVEILGQIRRAREQAEAEGQITPALHRLVGASLRAARQTREESQLGQGKVSVSSLAVEIARTHTSRFAGATALVLGAGEVGVQAARILRDRGIGRLVVSNRSLDKARIVAASLKCDAIRREEITTHLALSDIVLTATSAPHPVLRRAHIEEARTLAPARSLILIDLSTPANIARDVLDVPNVRLVTLADIQELVETNQSIRNARVEEAEALTLRQVERFLESLDKSTGAAASREAVNDPAPFVKSACPE